MCVQSVIMRDPVDRSISFFGTIIGHWLPRWNMHHNSAIPTKIPVRIPSIRAYLYTIQPANVQTIVLFSYNYIHQVQVKHKSVVHFSSGLVMEGGKLLSADVTALFTNSSDIVRVMCWVSAIMLC